MNSTRAVAVEALCTILTLAITLGGCAAPAPAGTDTPPIEDDKLAPNAAAVDVNWGGELVEDGDTCRSYDTPDVIAVPADMVALDGAGYAEVFLPDGGVARVPENEIVFGEEKAGAVALVYAAPQASLWGSQAFAALAASQAIPVVGQVALVVGAVVLVGVLVYTYWDEITSFCRWLWDSAVEWWQGAGAAISSVATAATNRIASWLAFELLTPAAATLGASIALEELLDKACNPADKIEAVDICDYWFHYTDEEGLAAIVGGQALFPNSAGIIYATWAPMGPADALQNLFIGNRYYAGKGDYVVMFQRADHVVFTPGQDFWEVEFRQGRLQFERDIFPIYIGPNPFAVFE